MADHRKVLHDGSRWRAVYSRRTRDEHMGRFGGGWQWEVGIQAGGTSVIVNLLVASIRFTNKRKLEARRRGSRL